MSGEKGSDGEIAGMQMAVDCTQAGNGADEGGYGDLLMLLNLLLDLASFLGEGLKCVLVGRVLVLQVCVTLRTGHGLGECFRKGFRKDSGLNLPCCFLILASWALAMVGGGVAQRQC